MVDDTVYTVIDGVDTNTGGPSSSFYEKGTVYQAIQLANDVLATVQAQAAQAAAAALTVSTAVAGEAAIRAAADVLLAPLNSPGFSGVPTAPTATLGTNTTQLATTAFVLANAAPGGASPATANPLADGASAVGISAKYAREDHVHPTDTSRAPLVSPGFSGVPTAPTAAAATNNTQLATTAYTTTAVAAEATLRATADALLAPLNSPGFSGVPTAPTASIGTNTTQLASTAFVQSALRYPPGFIYGLTLSNNVTTPTTVLNIASGSARDLGDAQNMVLASGITKSLASVWAVGTGNGGLDSGTKANSTWYHVYLIRRSDTGVVDVLFSTSATAPTMPTNYDAKRRLGTILTDASGNIVLFYQTPGTGEFRRRSTSAPRDVNNVSVTGLTATLFTVSLPLGIKVRGIFLFQPGTGAGACSVTDPDAGPPPDNTYSQASAGNFDEIVSWCNTTSQIYMTTGATATMNLWTKGWFDYRDAAF